MNQEMRGAKKWEMPVRESCGGGMEKEHALSFAAWELRLYLDTHPEDECALAAYHKLCAANPGYACNYACAGTGADDCACGSGKVWGWIDSPWPWEREANEKEVCR